MGIADLLSDPHGRKNVVIGIAGILIGLLFGFLSFRGGGPEKSEVTNGAPTIAPGSHAKTQGWQRVPERPGVFGNSDIEQVNAVIRTPDGWFAVGSHNYEAAAWHATNPLEWTKLTRVEPGNADRPALIWSVAYAEGRYVAVGKENDQAAIWTSTDGRTWRLVDRPIGVFGSGTLVSQTLAVTYWHGTWYVAGSFRATSRSPDLPTVWLSKDTRHWERATIQSAGFVVGDRPYVVHLAVSENLMVAVGNNNSLAVPGGTRAYIWTSRDGRTWQPATVIRGTLAPRNVESTLSSVAYGHGMWVAVGRAGGGSQQWTSDDGVSWSSDNEPSGRVDRRAEVAMNDVKPTKDGWVAVGSSADVINVTDAAVWTSPDGRNWRQVFADPEVFGGPDKQLMTGVVVTKDVTVGVGWDASTGDFHGAVWVQAPPGRR